MDGHARCRLLAMPGHKCVSASCASRNPSRALIEAEASEWIRTEHGQRNPERLTNRNGYRPRRSDTPAGEIELASPKIHRSAYRPSFLEPSPRSEQALASVEQQAYVCRVTTRKVDHLRESLGLRISRSEVPRLWTPAVRGRAGVSSEAEAPVRQC